MYKLSEFTKPMYKIGEVGSLLGVTNQTLHNYDNAGLLQFERTSGGHRVVRKDELVRYLDSKGLLLDDLKSSKYDIIYVRVPTIEQETNGELDRQAIVIMEGFTGKIKNPIILKEVGNGFNDRRKQLSKLVDMIINNEVNAVYIASPNRLTRFGLYYIEKICAAHGVQIYSLYNNADDNISESIKDFYNEDDIND